MRYLAHQPRSVALVCMGPSVVDFISETFTQTFTPAFADEIWAINMAANGVWHDVCFWLDDIAEENKIRPGLFAAMRRRGRPVITATSYPDIVPTSYPYPAQEIISLGWPVFGRPYLNNGVAMAVAYALWKGVRRLKIYGADFTYPDRAYGEMGRACIESWIVFASHQGMEVVLATHSSLFDTVDLAPAPPEYVPQDTSGRVMSDGEIRLRPAGYGE